MWLLIIGILILLIAAFWHSYSAVGSSTAPIIAPMLFGSRRKIDFILVNGWLILFVVGVIILFLENWLVGIIAILVYWFVLPLLINPFVTKWILPSWDDMPDKLKATLEEMGYNRKNYLHGNWWKKDFTKGEYDKLKKEK
jgi:ABC-type multidrug transport system fused ATPase/permease subunit